MATRKVSLVVNYLGHGMLCVDGEEITNIRSVRITARAGALTKVELELVNVEVDAEIETDEVCETQSLSDN